MATLTAATPSSARRTAACPLCKSTDLRTRFRLRAYSVARCRRCDFQFNAEFVGGGGAEGTFSEDYYRQEQTAGFAQQFADFRRDPSTPVYLQRLEIMERHAPPGRLLDVGCGLGVFLRLAKERGWQAEGVELSQFAAGYARQTHGVPVFNGMLSDFDAADESYDAVTFWDSIEHVAQPREDLLRAVRLLRPGGVLLLTTDNFACLVADVAAMLYHVSLGRFTYPVERVFIDRNLAYFTGATFRKLIDDAGLRTLLWEKMEFPLDKIETNLAERLILQGFYAAAKLLGRQAQVTVIGQKP